MALVKERGTYNTDLMALDKERGTTTVTEGNLFGIISFVIAKTYPTGKAGGPNVNSKEQHRGVYKVEVTEADVPNKPTVSVVVTQHFNQQGRQSSSR